MKLQKNSYIHDIKTILELARKKSYTAINAVMIEAYRKIGERIVLQEQNGEDRAKYGESILKELSQALTQEFGKGFSYANLYNMRQFYLAYQDFEIFYTLCRKLTWSHNRLIMRVEDIEARKFYLQEAFNSNWSVRTLERNINTFYYRRLLSSQKNDKMQDIQPENMAVKDFIKDPYVFEFLGIEQSHKINEKTIENALINTLQDFLLELGKGFSFVERQFRISTELEHYYIDLVFYNYILKCFVLIDLKTTKLSHQDIGQMDMYRRMFDDLKKRDDDNPTIGIILCAEKSETVVRYSAINDNDQMFVAKFMPYLPTEEELKAEIDRKKTELQLLGSKDER
ncbi:MAG: PDDEXK nuclease domain-containing protein [Spirochaetales bacterium]